VAEMTSAFVCASLGIVPTVRHADYIGSWLEVLREDDRAIVRAASAASKAADYLLAFRPDTDRPVEVPTVTDHLPTDYASGKPVWSKNSNGRWTRGSWSTASLPGCGVVDNG
jgi:Zincin-like metallopeptidase